MSPPAKGAHLWLRPARRDANGNTVRDARWIIKDRGEQVSTGLGAGERAEAEKRLALYISEKYQPARRERPLATIKIADVIKIYLDDVVPGQARPERAAERAERLLQFFGMMTLDRITGSLCREYATWRHGQGHSNKGKGGGAKRDLEDLRAAINHHAKEGLHRGVVRIVLPERGKARQRWLTRNEAARLLWTCWHTREVQEGKATGKHPLRHLCRFLLLGLYTGSRPGAMLTAAWERAPGISHIDLDRDIFHRHAEGTRETDKRQPSVKLAPRLAAHLARWRRMDGAQGRVVRFAGAPILSTKKAMGTAVRLAGLTGGVTAYTLRHTAATWLVSRGVPIWDVAGFLGTSPEMIERHYGHYRADYQDAATRMIGRK